MTNMEAKYPILFKEWPYVYVVSDHLATAYCHYCLSKGDKFLNKLSRCSRCKFAHYCGRKCQVAAYSDHQEECRCLAELGGHIPDKELRYFARIIFKRKAAEPKPDERLPVDLQKQQFSDLRNCADVIKKDKNRKRRIEHQETYEELCNYLGNGYRVSLNEMVDVIGRLTVNTYDILVNEVPHVASAVYLGTSGLKHSCDPDAFYGYDGPTIVIRALKPGLNAKPASEWTMCFFDPFMSTHDRQKYILEKYFFRCKCSACRDKQRDGEMCSILCAHCSGPAILSDKTTATCRLCKKTTDSTEALKLMKAIGRFLEVQDVEPGQPRLQWDMPIEYEPFGKRLLLSIALDLPFSFDFEEVTDKLDKGARKLLTDVNVYSSRLSSHLTTLAMLAHRPTAEVAFHCDRAIKGYQLFALPYSEQRLIQLMHHGIISIRIPSRIKEGIKLLKEASEGFSLIGDQSAAGTCREEAMRAALFL